MKKFTYYVFLRGSRNACNVVGDCVWVGDAVSRDAAVEQAVEDGCAGYNNQYLEALPASAMTGADREAVEEFSMIEALELSYN